MAVLQFVVDARGTPVLATARLISASTPEFGAAARSSLPRWRYAPAQRGGQGVRQLVNGRLAVKDERVPFVVLNPGERPPPAPPVSSMPCESTRQTKQADGTS